LLKGNERFLLLKLIQPPEDLRKLKDVAKGQHPFAVSLFIH